LLTFAKPIIEPKTSQIIEIWSCGRMPERANGARTAVAKAIVCQSQHVDPEPLALM
jgi:hypothetical protein